MIIIIIKLKKIHFNSKDGFLSFLIKMNYAFDLLTMRNSGGVVFFCLLTIMDRYREILVQSET